MNTIRFAVMLLGLSVGLKAQPGTFSNMTTYPLPTAGSFPLGITAGPDGALWFTENSGNNVARVTTGGAIIEYPLPTPESQPAGIAAGPDGALWFAEQGSNRIGRITTAGVLTEYPVPTANSGPWWIATGPDRALWFTEFYGNKIGRISTTGVIAEYPLATPVSSPTEITAGADDALWFTEYRTLLRPVSIIGRITTSGEITEYQVQPVAGGTRGITSGPDGALWFTDTSGTSIGRITAAGEYTYYPLPNYPNQCCADGITAGPDGAIWFTLYSGLGRITTSGVITEYAVPTAASDPDGGITAGPDGALWFTGENVGRAPACGLGFSAGFANGTLTMNFDIGIDMPATFNILLHTSAGISRPFSKAIPIVVPPQSLTMNWTLPDLGSVTVQPVLTAGRGGAICSQWTTVDTTQ